MSDHGVTATPIFDELRDETGIDFGDEPSVEHTVEDDVVDEEDVRAAG
jgi:hypothetical protein